MSEGASLPSTLPGPSLPFNVAGEYPCAQLRGQNLQFNYPSKLTLTGDRDGHQQAGQWADMDAVHTELKGIHRVIKEGDQIVSGEDMRIQAAETKINQMKTTLGGIKQELYEVHMTGS